MYLGDLSVDEKTGKPFVIWASQKLMQTQSFTLTDRQQSMENSFEEDKKEKQETEDEF